MALRGTDQRAELVAGEVHRVEVGQAVAAGNILAFQLDLPEGLVLVLLKVREAELVDTALQRVGGHLCSRHSAPGKQCVRGVR